MHSNNCRCYTAKEKIADDLGVWGRMAIYGMVSLVMMVLQLMMAATEA